ncbi:hypothetical protein V8E54_012738 [Elaphomyces granulatus]|jgi:hypothetical protein
MARLCEGASPFAGVLLQAPVDNHVLVLVSEEKLVLWRQGIVLQLYLPTKLTRKRRDPYSATKMKKEWRACYEQIEQLAKESLMKTPRVAFSYVG